MLLPDAKGPPDLPSSTPSIGWRFEDCELDTTRAQLRRAGVPVPLERSGYELLRRMLEGAGQMVAKDALLQAGWPGRVVSENSLAKAIGKLRQAIGDGDASRIRAVHGYGYRFAAAVEPLHAPASVAAPAAEAPGANVQPPLAWRRAGLLALLALALLALASWQWRTRAPLAATRSAPLAAAPVIDERFAHLDVIAVLPLRDLSADRSLSLLADGVADFLHDELRRIPALRLVNRGPIRELPATLADTDSAARELGANLIVSGEISYAGDRLHVLLNLRDTRGRVPAWSRRFERPPYDQATLLADLSAALIDSLAARPERWGNDPQRGRGTANPEAHRTLLRAVTLYRGNLDPNSQRRAIAVLEQALELDPNYADALLMLGGLLGGSGYYADSPEQLRQGRVRALATMDRGLALAPDDPLQYLLRSEMRLLYAFDWDGAWADIEAAEALTPGGESPHILVWKARYLASAGRLDEAIATGARSIALDPLAGGRRNQGWHYLAKGDTRNARAVLTLQLEDMPENPHVNFYLALCDIFEGQPEPALKRLELSSTLFRLLGTTIAQHERGDRAASDLALRKLTGQFAIADGYWVGAAYAWRGEFDQAYHWIERAARSGDSSVMYLPFDPLLRDFRRDPRYHELLARLRVPE